MVVVLISTSSTKQKKKLQNSEVFLIPFSGVFLEVQLQNDHEAILKSYRCKEILSFAAVDF